MYKITVKGEASVWNEHSDTIELDKLNGTECGDCFSGYMRSDRCSAVDVISGGYLHFKYEDGRLWSITEYDSTRILTDIELEEVKSYTQGQWSDGIGEGFEQSPCNSHGDYISPWTRNQIVTISDNRDEVREREINGLIKN